MHLDLQVANCNSGDGHARRSPIAPKRSSRRSLSVEQADGLVVGVECLEPELPAPDDVTDALVAVSDVNEARG